MPHGNQTPAKATAAERAARFSAWLVRTMDERKLTNGNLVRRINRPGYDSATITNWRAGRYAPSELGAWILADALNLPVPQVLREAGYEEMAGRVERVAAQGVAPSPRDSTLDLLDSVGDPDWAAPVAAEYERELAAARHRVMLEIQLREHKGLARVIEMVELGEKLVAERERGENGGNRDAS